MEYNTIIFGLCIIIIILIYPCCDGSKPQFDQRLWSIKTVEDRIDAIHHWSHHSKVTPILLNINVLSNGTSSSLMVSHFWKSTGFCPAERHKLDGKWFLQPDMIFNLAFIGGIPFSGIQQVRIHWLLDSVTVKGYDDSVPVYNFTDLDALIDLLWQHNLKPGFEVMGNPSNIFNDFNNKTQVYMWRALIYDIAKRYIDIYGIDYVSTWNFETWNEPKTRHFDGLNFTLKGFYNYYDATYDALKTASKLLTFGGPGGECHNFSLESFCWGLLNHIVHGVNYITGKVGTGIDYISIHKKGEEPNNCDTIFEKEKDFYTQLTHYLPQLQNISIYNDEGDPLVGWSRPKWWRADTTYAANIAKVIVEHQNNLLSKPNNTFNLKLFSNDNGFLSYNPNFFTQRTLLARFQMNNTNPHHIQFIRKPVYSVMALLSYLGEKHLPITIESDGKHSMTLGSLGTFHTGEKQILQDSNQVAVLIYNSADTHNITSEARLQVTLYNVISTTSDHRYIVYQLDNTHGNPYSVWLKEGSPKTPSYNTFRKMRENEEPAMVLAPQSVMANTTSLTVNISLPLPGVALIHICAKSILPPDQVTGVKILNITCGQVLIVWNDIHVKTKCIKTYVIDFLHINGDNQFKRINIRNTVFNTFVFVADESSDKSVHGSYRIGTVDYWNRVGEYSLVVNYP